jgi:DNA-directed RNA polymerase specialized sigma24 family protein
MQRLLQAAPQTQFTNYVAEPRLPRMAQRKVKRERADGEVSGKRIAAEEKIARLLGLLLVKDIKRQTDKVPILRRAGFEVAEVAEMLGLTENHVRVADHLGRKKLKSE